MASDALGPPMRATKSGRGRKTPELDDPAVDKGASLLKSLDSKRAEEVVMTEGVPQSVYLGYIKRELDNESACMELPLTIIMLCSFLVLALFLLNQSKIYAVEEAVGFDIKENANFAWAHNFGHKGINDVNSVADFWSWVRLGFLPLMVQPSWVYSENYPPALGAPVFDGTNYGRPHGPEQWNFSGYQRPSPHRNDYLRYNRLMGGMLFRQWITPAANELCRVPLGLDRNQVFAWLGKPCMPSTGLGMMSPEIRDVEVFEGGVRRQFLHPEIDTLDEMLRVLVDMEDGCTHASGSGQDIKNCRCEWCKQQSPRQPWIDEQTERVEISFVMFNPVYGLYTYVGTNFLFNRGGHIHKLINVMSVWADPVTAPLEEVLPTYIAGGIWVLCLLYVMTGETREMIGVCRSTSERFWKALYEDYLGIWNVIDWVSIFVGAVVIFLYFQMRQVIDIANLEFRAMVERSHATMTGAGVTREQYQETASAFFVSVENSVIAEKTFRMILAIYPNMLMLRLFKSFAAQPRLAIVTATLSRASGDLLHFFIVFFSVYICMVVNSVLLFGQDLEEFCTIPRALHTCFLAMFGDWDWLRMKEIGFVKAQAWFWIFLLVMVLILLNMLLAIFMDAYTAVKQKASNALTLLEQVLDMRRRRNMFRRGERIRLNDVWNVFSKEYNGDEKRMLLDDRRITVDFLLSTVPRMQLAQAKRTLTNSLIAEEKSNTEDAEEEQVMDIRTSVDKVERQSKLIIEDLSFAVDRTRYYDRIRCSGDPEFEFHFGGEGRSATQETQDAVNQAVTGLSGDICGLFADHLRHIENHQTTFEKQQNELHGLIAEMQMMVRQQAWAVTAIQEAASQLGVMDEPPVAEGGAGGIAP